MKLTNKQIRDRIEEAESLPYLLLEAIDYLRLIYQQQLLSEAQLQQRLDKIYLDYRRSHTYEQAKSELIYGAKVAWRNSTIGAEQIFWESLNVRDLRHLTTAEEIFAEIVNHIQQATNEGNIRSTISIFAPDFPGQPGIQIWNSQFICYAGYRQTNGSIIGDPDQTKLTRLCQDLGWQGQGTAFDILPLVIQMPGKPPQWFELPSENMMEVSIAHPDYEWFTGLGLKWHVLPTVTNWRLEIGGISYSCAPFNGWYMNAETVVRNISKAHRYNVLPSIARRMGLNTGSTLSIWKDQALFELNRAVLHSFTMRGVSIVDRENATAQRMQYWHKEAQAKQITPADRSRTRLPLSVSIAKVLAQEKQFICLKPNFFPQPAR